MRFLPLLIQGVVKSCATMSRVVQELLLYYIRAGESCIASFNAAVFRRTSQIKSDHGGGVQITVGSGPCFTGS